jgi:L-rhamnose mutarotase
MTVASRFTFTTTLLPGHEADYDEIHRVTPVELDRVIRAAGARFWRIERDGTRLIHYVEVRDPGEFDRVLDASEVNAQWQLVVGPLLEPDASPRTIVDEFEFEEGELVWELLPDD